MLPTFPAPSPQVGDLRIADGLSVAILAGIVMVSGFCLLIHNTRRHLSTYQAGWGALKDTRYQRQVDLGIVPAGLKFATPSIIPDWSSLSVDERRMDTKRMAVHAGMLEFMDMSIGLSTSRSRYPFAVRRVLLAAYMGVMSTTARISTPPAFTTGCLDMSWMA